MYIRNVLISGLAAASTVQAYGNYANYTIRDEKEWIVTTPAPTVEKRLFGKVLGLIGNIFGNNQQQAECPAVWNQISETLTQQFLADGQCTDSARAAIRSSFHDCFPGSCDGSLILADECSKSENRGLERLCSNLANVASQTSVGVADLIQFAAAHAVKTCPGGPTIPVYVGRKDSSEANAYSILPSAFAKGGDLVRLFGKHHPHLDTRIPHTNKLSQLPKAFPLTTSPLSSAPTPPPSNASPTPRKPAPPSTLLLVPGTTSTTPRPSKAKPPSP